MGREVKRVPLLFDYPLKETWIGYLNPYYVHRKECPSCDGSGYSPKSKLFHDQWYGNAPFDPVEYGAKLLSPNAPEVVAFAERNVDHDPDFYRVPFIGRDTAIDFERRRLYRDCFAFHWSHNLIQADVDVLIAEHRLSDFTRRWDRDQQKWVDLDPVPVVMADMVNSWSISGGMGHDSMNEWICVKARCAREGVDPWCIECKGDGDLWPSNAHKQLYEAWANIEPPTGDGWQLWETTSDGSPFSPVFSTPEELATWASDNATTFASVKATYGEWLEMIQADFIYHQEGNRVFV